MDSPLTIDEQIEQEMEEWKKVGIPDPIGHIQSNTFLGSVQIMALKKVMVEKGIISEEDVQLVFKQEMLEALQTAREGVRQARMGIITQGIIKH